VHWNAGDQGGVNPRQHEGYQPAARYSKKSRARIVPRCTSEVAGRGWVPGTLQLLSTLLYQRTGVTGPLVTIFRGTFPGQGSGALVPAGSRLPRDSEKRPAIIRPKKPWVLRFGGKWLLRNHRRNAHASRNVARSHLDTSSLEGPLRVGKTTLARLLAERLHARRIYDCEDNPFLADFYAGLPGAAFRTQLYS